MELIKTEAKDTGLCCNSCGEEIDIHHCSGCDEDIMDGEIIYCKSNSQLDNEHYHERCKPKILSKKD